MADWTDGPEYAPHARPGGFVAPDAAPLSGPPAAAPSAPALSGPSTPPPAYQQPAAPALGQLIPPPPQVRDPHAAFAVASAPLGGADDPVAAPRRPEDPFPMSAAATPPRLAPASSWPPPEPVTSWPPPAAWPSPGPSPVPASQTPAPAAGPQAPVPAVPDPRGPYAPLPSAPQQPGAPGQPGGGPAPWQAQQRPHSQVTLPQMAKATTPGVLIALVLGGLIPPLSAPLFLVAWGLATRIRYRRATVQKTFLVIACLVLGLTLFDTLATTGTFDLFAVPEYAQPWARLANFALLIWTPLIVGQALRNGEPPEETP